MEKSKYNPEKAILSLMKKDGITFEKTEDVYGNIQKIIINVKRFKHNLGNNSWGKIDFLLRFDKFSLILK